MRLGTWAASLVAAVGLGWMASSLIGPGRTASVAAHETTAAPQVAAPRPAVSLAAADTGGPRLAVDRTPKATPVRLESTSRPPAARRARRRPARTRSAPRSSRCSTRHPRSSSARWKIGAPTRARSSKGCGGRCPGTAPRPRPAERPAHRRSAGAQVQVQSDRSEQAAADGGGPAARGRAGHPDHRGPRGRRLRSCCPARGGTSTDGKLGVTVTEATPGIDQAMAMQLGDRMLAITGALPSDSLRAMIRRMNAEMRSK